MVISCTEHHTTTTTQHVREREMAASACVCVCSLIIFNIYCKNLAPGFASFSNEHEHGKAKVVILQYLKVLVRTGYRFSARVVT